VRSSPWSAMLLLALCGHTNSLRAEDLEGSVTLSGDVVRVRVFGDKGKPAADIPLRLRDSNKKIVAAGRTDLAGSWSYPLEHGGKYEVEIVGGPAEDDLLHWPFSLSGPAPSEPPSVVLMLPCCRAASAAMERPAPPVDFPIETVALGIGCLGAAGSLLLLLRLGTPA
jgi:hypothetical protein